MIAGRADGASVVPMIAGCVDVRRLRRCAEGSSARFAY
jgi:hypothetical protein